MNKLEPPEFVVEPGWTKLSPPIEMGQHRTFVSGEPGGDRIRILYCRHDANSAVVGKVWFGQGAQGPPGYVHGGAMAAVMDEAMGAAVWNAGHMALAARLEVDFRGVLCLGTVTHFDTAVELVQGRKITTRGRIFGKAGTVCCEARGLFIAQGAERFKKMVSSETTEQ